MNRNTLEAADKVQQGYRERKEAKEYSLALLELVLGGEKIYPHKGKFYLVDRQVDTKTGTIRVAALFPNPNNLLRPGQFARVRAVTQDQGEGDPRSAAGSDGNAG